MAPLPSSSSSSSSTAAAAAAAAPSSTKAEFGTLWTVRARAGEPLAVIRVNGLHTVLRGAAKDAWGRPCRAQSLRVSAELSFARPFGFAAAADRLGDDTVHYGNLAKAIMLSLAPYTAEPPATAGAGAGGADAGAGAGASAGAGATAGATASAGVEPAAASRLQKQPRPQLQARAAATATATATAGPSLRDVLDAIWLHLTGRRVDGSLPPLALQNGSTAVSTQQQQPFLPPETMARLRFMSIRLSLPKASLLGEEVSLTGCAVFDTDSSNSPAAAAATAATSATTKQVIFGTSLGVHRLRVPTLLGVNENERVGKQVVVATVELDRFDDRPDIYTVLENIVVTTLESSSFETLEALGAHIAKAILAKFNGLSSGWQVRITLEKPSAIMLADCPVVEIRVGPN